VLFRSRWPSAQLTGLDGSVGMLDVARREHMELPKSARAHITFVQADAAAIPSPDGAFDLAMTCFVLQQVSDRPAVLGELQRVIRPGGTLAISGWLDEKVPFAPELEMEAALREAGVVRPASAEVKAGPYHTIRGATDELRAAGFTRIASLSDSLEHRWTIDDFVEYRATTRDLELFESLEAQTRRRVRDILRRRLEALAPEQLVYRPPFVSIVARRNGA
jgi:SAM-dependent methyltransferase